MSTILSLGLSLATPKVAYAASKGTPSTLKRIFPIKIKYFGH